MGQYSSFFLYQKYEKRGTQDWIPCYPNLYSISGDSEITMPIVEKSSADTACGYVPKGSDDYNYEKWEIVDGYICDDTTKYARERKYVSDDNASWIATDIYRRSSVILDINSTDCGYDSQWDEYNCYKWEVVSGDYTCNEGNKYQKLRKYFRICDDCDNCNSTWSASEIYKQGDVIEYDSTVCGYVIGERMYRWINLNPSTDYYCESTSKYYKQQRQVSYNSGQTWSNLDEYRKGMLYEENSSDCSTPIIIYRWVNLDPSIDYYCSGTTKYYKQQKQQSIDNGTTWTNVSPAEYQMGSRYQTASTDCGYVEPQYRTISSYTCYLFDEWLVEKKQVSYDEGQTWIDSGETLSACVETDSSECDFEIPDMTNRKVFYIDLRYGSSRVVPLSQTSGITNCDGSNIYSGQTDYGGTCRKTTVLGTCISRIKNNAFQYHTGGIDVGSYYLGHPWMHVVLPNTIVSIDTGAFIGTRIDKLEWNIVNSVAVSIGESCFQDAYIRHMTFNPNITSIGTTAFARLTCDITSINFNRKVTLHTRALASSPFKTITFNNGFGVANGDTYKNMAMSSQITTIVLNGSASNYPSNVVSLIRLDFGKSGITIIDNRT